jgi:hypothetical protein
MKSLLSNTLCRALTVVAYCLGAVIAPVTAGVDCRASAVPAECKCCRDPQAGCCAANKSLPEKRVPVAPVQTPNLRDVAPAPVTLFALLPPFGSDELANTSIGAVVHPPHVARHSLLCIRTI